MNLRFGLDLTDFTSKEELSDQIVTFAIYIWHNLRYCANILDRSNIPRALNLKKIMPPFFFNLFISILLYISLTTFFGIPLIEVFKYLLFFILFNLVPGAALYFTVSKVKNDDSLFFSSSILGFLLHVFWSQISFNTAGEPTYWIYLVIALLLSSIFLYFRPLAENISESKASISYYLNFSLIALLLVFQMCLFNFNQQIDQHFLWVAAYSNSAFNGWPIREPFIFGLKLFYHYLPNLHIAEASHFTGIPTLTIGTHLFTTLYITIFLNGLFSLIFKLSSSLIITSMCSVLLFFTHGYNNIWKYFHLVTSSIILRLPSLLIGYCVFIYLAIEMNKSESLTKKNWRHITLIVIPIFISSGIRAQLLPVLICSMAVVLLYSIKLKSKIFENAIILISCLSSLIYGLFYFYGMKSPGSGTGIISVDFLNSSAALIGTNKWSPLYTFLVSIFKSEAITTFFFIILTSIGRLSFLLPGFIFYFVDLIKRRTSISNLEVFFVSSYIAGIGAVSLVSSPHQEQWMFMLFGDLGAVAISSIGFKKLFDTIKFNRSAQYKLASIVSLLILFQLTDFFHGVYSSVEKLSSKREYPSLKNQFKMQGNVLGFIEWLENELPDKSIIVFVSSEKFDERFFSAIKPGIELYGSSRILEIYSHRNDMKQFVKNRLSLIESDFSQENLERLKEELPSDKNIFIVAFKKKLSIPLQTSFRNEDFTAFRLK